MSKYWVNKCCVVMCNKKLIKIVYHVCSLMIIINYNNSRVLSKDVIITIDHKNSNNFVKSNHQVCLSFNRTPKWLKVLRDAHFQICFVGNYSNNWYNIRWSVANIKINSRLKFSLNRKEEFNCYEFEIFYYPKCLVCA